MFKTLESIVSRKLERAGKLRKSSDIMFELSPGRKPIYTNKHVIIRDVSTRKRAIMK